MKKSGLIKKIVIVLVVLVVIAAIAGSGGKKDKSKDESSSASTESAQVQADESTTDESSEADTQEEVATEETGEPNDTNGIDETTVRPEFKEAMDSYEAFFDEYVDFMKKYNENPSDADLLLELSEMTAKEAVMIKEFDDWENEEDMTLAETSYYLEVQSRIYAKLAEVA